MKMKLLSILILLTTNVFATVDYLVVNHLTKQLYWAETDHAPGFIGWSGVGEIYEIKEQQYLDSGYTYTNNPFLIEEGVLVVLTLLITAYYIRRKKKTLYNTM